MDRFLNDVNIDDIYRQYIRVQENEENNHEHQDDQASGDQKHTVRI